MTSTLITSCKKTIYFRCDASTKVGVGHMMRCLTLAEAMKDLGWSCCFITNESSSDIVPELKTSSFAVYPEDYIPESANILLVDHYNLDIKYESDCRSWAQKVVVIDDLANRKHDCDLLLDQTYQRPEEDYKDLAPKHCHIITGKDYMLVRSQFLDAREKSKLKRKSTEKVENILINFGSTNPHSISQRILNVVSEFKEWKLKANVILSSKADDIEEIKNICEDISSSTGHKFELQTDVRDMADYMLEADMAFGAGGSTSWERASLGLPTAMITLADNQALVSKTMHAEGAAYNLGSINSLNEADIRTVFEKMRDNKDLLREMSEKSFMICDAKGAIRMARAMNELV